MRLLTRRRFIGGAAGVAALGLIGCSQSNGTGRRTTGNSLPSPQHCPAPDHTSGGRRPLWQTALDKGIVYGSSTATWQIGDRQYRRLFARETAILFTEDDLLWYRLRPSPDSGLDFRFGDQIIGFAEREGMLVIGAHVVWDEGFGEGWTDDDLWGMGEATARDVLFGTVDAVVKHYLGRVAAWIVANEVLDGTGLRTNVPWYETIGPTYVADTFHTAHDADPDALLVLNDFGYETDDDFAPAVAKRAAAIQFLDELLGADVPVHAFGVQAHLNAGVFAEEFDAQDYSQFLSEVADRGVDILITEMDVLDDGLPADVRKRDRAVAETIRSYLDVALDQPAVRSLITFGLSDRYTWLQEDYPREDRAARRPLPFDDRLRPKPAYAALSSALAGAPTRDALWAPPRCN